MKSAVDQLFKIFDLTSTFKDIESFLNVLSAEVQQIMNAEVCCIALYDKIMKEIYYYKNCGEKKSTNATFLRSKLGTGIIGWVTYHRQAIRIKNAHDDDRFVKKVDEQGNYRVGSLLAVPMISRGELIGVIEVVNQKSRGTFSLHDQKLLSILVTQAAQFIDNVRLSEEILTQAHLSDLGHSIASSAHGLKNILNNLDGGAFIVERGVSTKNMETVNKGWDILKRNSQRMREIVLDMLLFTHPRAPEYNPTDINKLCLDLYELVHDSAKQRNIEVLLDLDPKVSSACVDPRGIHRCVLNLISNAFDACDKPQSYVKIMTKCLQDKGLRILVSDNGKGISKTNLDHIFDVFFTTKGSRGTGLGLPVTQKIISEHQGTVEVKSKLGKGTTFIITLPRIKGCG